MNFVVRKIVRSKWFRQKILEKGIDYFDNNPEEFDAMIDIFVMLYNGAATITSKISQEVKYEFVRQKYFLIMQKSQVAHNTRVIQIIDDGMDYYKLVYVHDDHYVILPLIMSRQQFMKSKKVIISKLLLDDYIQKKDIVWENGSMNQESVGGEWKIDYLTDGKLVPIRARIIA